MSSRRAKPDTNFIFESQIQKRQSNLKDSVDFNSPLSPVDRWRRVASVKARVAVKVTVPQRGGSPMYQGSAEAIVIRRVDILKVHDYARQNCDLRDYMLVRLPLKIGLRTGEVCTLQIKNIDFDNRSFCVLDSKRKTLYPLPLDQISLQLIKDLVGKRVEGYVFTHKCSWMHERQGYPLTRSTVWFRVKSIAAAAGVKGLKPRTLRQYFAADWAMQHKNLEVLRRILRHKSLAFTQIYLSRLIFWEDMQQEYERIQDAPFVGRVPVPPPQMTMTGSLLSPFYQEWCVSCGHVQLCKLCDQTPAWALGCRFYIKIPMEECKNDERKEPEPSKF